MRVPFPLPQRVIEVMRSPGAKTMLACVSLGAPNTLVRELSENVSWTPRKVLELYHTSSPLTTRELWFKTHLQAW